jgi:hypothetical protein
MLAVAFWVLRGECIGAETVGAECLTSAAAPINAIREPASQFLNWVTVESYFDYSIAVALGCLGLLTLMVLVAGGLSGWSFLYVATIALALCGELEALRGKPYPTLWYQLAALCTAVLGFVLMVKRERVVVTEKWIAPGRYQVLPRFLEVVSVGLLLVIMVVMRFYALNTVPATWDAETCPHRSIAASWSMIIEQELGAYVQQSSGMMWVVLHKLFTGLKDPLLFFLDQRILGAGVSFVALWTVYFLVRFLRGPFAATLALIVYGFGPLDLEWAHLPTLHHVPVVVGLLLTWAAFAAFNRKTWKAFFALALLIVSTKFVYPSAKLLALGPCLGVCGAILWDRREWFGHKRKLSLVLLGGALFAVIRSIMFMIWNQRWELVTPVPMVQSVQAGESVFETAKLAAWQAFGYLYEIFYRPFSPTHWTVHATIEPLRSMPSICIVFATLALVRLLFLVRNMNALICIGLLIGGLIPGIVTGMAERRAAFSLVFLTLLAVIEIAWFLDIIVGRKLPRLAKIVKGSLLVTIGVALLSLQTEGYFSSHIRHRAIPSQILYSKTVRPMLRPDTLVVYLAEETRCEFFYGIYDHLVNANGRIGFATADDANKSPAGMIQSPEPTLNSWYYTMTDLEAQVKTLQVRSDWPRVLYVFQDIPSRDEWKNALIARYPNGKGTQFPLSDHYRQTLFVFDTAP